MAISAGLVMLSVMASNTAQINLLCSGVLKIIDCCISNLSHVSTILFFWIFIYYFYIHIYIYIYIYYFFFNSILIS